MPERCDPTRLELEEGSEAWRLLAAHPDIETLKFRDGEYLVRENEDSLDLFLVLKGAFVVERASHRPDLPPVILATVLCDLEKPGIVGEMAYLGTHRRSASVRSSGGSFVLRLKPAHVDAVINDFHGLTRAICAQFSWRLRETSRALAELQGRFALGPQQRLAKAGERLFTRGEPAGTLFQLVTGRVKLEGDRGEELVSPEQLPQGFLEPEAFFRNRLHTATATVETAAFLVAIDREFIQGVVRAYPELVLKLLEG
jgi:CRP-like cAMP-binding protein